MIITDARGRVQVDPERCSGCGVCQFVCPQKCIAMHHDIQGFILPAIDDARCVHCRICERFCPCNKDYAQLSTADLTNSVYSVINDDAAILAVSSSGGAIAVLAEQAISAGGRFYGASFDEHWQLRHTVAPSISSAKKLFGSKYLQSDMRETLVKLAADLEAGRSALFVGTPCQVAAVRALYPLNNRLLTCDILCHGVGSQKVFDQYLDELRSLFQSEPKTINFRKKTNGWQNYGFCVEFENGVVHEVSGKENVYMCGYIENLFLRKSCYGCPFSGKKRQGDFTVGDFWGVLEFTPEIDVNNGVSLLIVNSDPARAIVTRIIAAEQNRTGTGIKIEKVECAESIAKYNHSLKSAVRYTVRRELFFELLGTRKFSDAYRIVSTTNRLKLLLWVALRKLKMLCRCK